MNDFVNPKKRGIQLPKGAKDLADVLQASHRRGLRKGKCDYCGAPAVAISICYAIPGVMDDEIHRWCDQCQRDLSEFAARSENKLPEDPDFDNDAKMERLSQQLAERKRREREFMRQRMRDRKRSDA
jgi:hypothetical protein